jgi:hypothetical protein
LFDARGAGKPGEMFYLCGRNIVQCLEDEVH